MSMSLFIDWSILATRARSEGVEGRAWPRRLRVLTGTDGERRQEEERRRMRPAVAKRLMGTTP